MSLSRRNLLRNVAAAGVGLFVTGSVGTVLTSCGAAAAGGYGSLVPDSAGRLALPPGFRYTVVSEAGRTLLESGEPTPSKHDGAGAFARPDGGTVIVYNHEIKQPLAESRLPVPHREGFVYDPGTAGGCTILEIGQDGTRLREYVGIAGTVANCAGGITPWNTWLTCEETDRRAGQGGATRDHGYVFEVDPFDEAANRDPQPIRALGRFEHEAAVTDPRTGDVYLTEDASEPHGLFYRWAAPAAYSPGRGSLRALAPEAGTLYAMRCTDGSGAHVPDLSVATSVGTALNVTWSPVPRRDAPRKKTREQLGDSDVTRGHKLEGAWWGDDGVYLVSSFARGRDITPHDGQVWFLDTATSKLTLQLRFGVNPDPEGGTAFDGPDNITMSPYGGLIVAENGQGLQHLIGVAADRTCFPLARAEAAEGEFCGPVYSPDRSTLFANLQGPDVTFAITGPWATWGET